tara:strand:- start:47 stop:709 length:663 start_codon:yes stop_codon:yes gene_type:complete
MYYNTSRKKELVSQKPIRRNPTASRKKILEAATEVFATQGLDGARVDDIAKRASINKRMLYHYFGNKDKLFGAVVENVYEGICADSEALNLATGTPTAALKRLVDFVIDYYLDNPHAIALLNAENLHEGRHLKNSKRIQNINRPFENMVENLLCRGEVNGIFRKGINPTRLYISIVALIYFYISNRHSLSIFFGKNLLKSREINCWRKHVHDITNRYVSV